MAAAGQRPARPLATSQPRHVGPAPARSTRATVVTPWSTKPGRLLRTQILIRCGSWNVTTPGYLEADTVDHGGDSVAGDFMRSITYTDIFCGWTEQAAIWNKSGHAVLQRTREIEAQLPVALLGFDSDNGGEFTRGDSGRLARRKSPACGYVNANDIFFAAPDKQSPSGSVRRKPRRWYHASRWGICSISCGMTLPLSS